MSHFTQRDAQIEGLLQRVNGDPSLAQQITTDPLAGLRAAGFDLDRHSDVAGVAMYMAHIPSCLDPPETNHYVQN
jgi:hypothetical protein